MWLIVSCVVQSKARVYTGESGGSYWTCLILPSSPQLLITFTLMMFQWQLITPPDGSLSLRLLFPCWLGSADMSSFLSWLQLVFESIQPSQHVCYLPVRWPHTPDLPTHCAHHANPCWSCSCSEVTLKTLSLVSWTMWDLCKTLNKATQNAESLCGVNHCMASFHQLSLVCSTIQSQ